MKKAPLLALSLVACGLGLLVLSACPRQTTNRSSAGSDDGTPQQLSPCLKEATIRVTTDPARVNYGQPSTVSWSVNLPEGCSAVQVRLNGETVGTTGSKSVTSPRSSMFKVVLNDTHGQRGESAEVAVVYPNRVIIDPSTCPPANCDPVQLLIGALTDPSDQHITVELCMDIDLTGQTAIPIGNNRSLIASSACERGPRRRPFETPLIYVRDERGSKPLFDIKGDNVRIAGFRLEGPTNYSAQGDRVEIGIRIFPAEDRRPIGKIEISNMEIFNWSGAGVSVLDNVAMAERGRLFNTNPGAVRVKGNFIHHNRHGAGFGYGVVSGKGAYLTIDQNVFDYNRHGIAGDSRHPDALDYSGYTARGNLILPEGGEHCLDWPVTGATLGLLLWGPPGIFLGYEIGTACWQTHQIDMHGDGNEWYSSNNHLCGTAGETMMIERNTILYTSGKAINIRGNPADKAVVDGNVFKHGSRSSAIEQKGSCGSGTTFTFNPLTSILWGIIGAFTTNPSNITKPIDVRNNIFNAGDTRNEVRSGDFVGDGKQDQFMATGATWWAKSPVSQEWRYLNTMNERLPDLVLVDVDGDGICDVGKRPPPPEVAPMIYSKSGTGPWKEREEEEPQGPILEQ